MASAPPEIKNVYGRYSGMPTRENVSTNRAMCCVITSEFVTLLTAASVSRSMKPSVIC